MFSSLPDVNVKSRDYPYRFLHDSVNYVQQTFKVGAYEIRKTVFGYIWFARGRVFKPDLTETFKKKFSRI